ncbi:hypothetical protein ACJX0J_014388, partial [Zea mays]
VLENEKKKPFYLDSQEEKIGRFLCFWFGEKPCLVLYQNHNSQYSPALNNGTIIALFTEVA